jgi:RNA recognition motif-containing protein
LQEAKVNIFVANLSFDTTEADMRKLFAGFGNVASVAIVMRRERKGSKSRGFGFVDMPDEEQVLAAITALDGQEFMGRPLDVSLAHPKPEKSLGLELRKKMSPKVNVEALEHPAGEGSQENTGLNPSLLRTGEYKRGKRSISFMKRRIAAGIKEPYTCARKYKDNPLRWRKKTGGAKR